MTNHTALTNKVDAMAPIQSVFIKEIRKSFEEK
jgi:hypothetical protein